MIVIPEFEFRNLDLFCLVGQKKTHFVSESFHVRWSPLTPLTYFSATSDSKYWVIRNTLKALEHVYFVGHFSFV